MSKIYKPDWATEAYMFIKTELNLQHRFEDIVKIIQLVNDKAKLQLVSSDYLEFSTSFSIEHCRAIWNDPCEGQCALWMLGHHPCNFMLVTSWHRDYDATESGICINLEDENYDPLFWFEVWKEILFFAENCFRVSHAAIIEQKAYTRFRNEHHGQLGLAGLGWAEYFGEVYAPILPDVAPICAQYSDVKYITSPKGRHIMVFGDSPMRRYWEMPAHKEISALFEPLMIPVDNNVNRELIQKLKDAPVLPAFDFSEVREGYEHIPEEIEKNHIFVSELLQKFELDSTWLAQFYKSQEVVPWQDPNEKRLSRFASNGESIARVFKKKRLSVKGLQFHIESLKALPTIISKRLKSMVNNEEDYREMLVGLAAFIGQIYCGAKGRWIYLRTSPIIRYSSDNGMMAYAFPFLEAKRLWEEASVANSNTVIESLAATKTIEKEPDTEDNDMKDNESDELNEETVEEARRHLADLALQVSREAFDITLDYSVESVRAVDKILQRIHEESTRTGEKDGLLGIAHEFGTYISYVIDKNFSPGKWRPHHSQFGMCSFPFEWNGITLFPTAWCEKQLLNGAEDSVWAKFMVITKRANSSSSSTIDNSKKNS